jgi:serine/threonine protein phosphatase PrpC
MHIESKEVKYLQYRLFLGGLSETGADKKINQDAFRIGAVAERELAYIIVADGLGSCKYSDQGAKRIVDIVEGWFLNQLPEYGFLSDNVANILVKRMVEDWIDSYGLKEIYDYDTTVHMVVFYKGSILVGGIGDGMALVSYDDIVSKDHIDEKNLFSNVTNSMCSLNVNELLSYEIVMNFSYRNRAVFILSTDGIADDLIPEKKLTLPDYFAEVISEKGIDSLQTELKEWVEDWETDGHSDDKTICYLVIEKEGQHD